MCCIDLPMMVLGVFTLVNGSFRISRDRVVWGVPARIIGALLVLPIFIAFAIFMVSTLVSGLQGQGPTEEDLRKLFMIILGISLRCTTPAWDHVIVLI